MRRTLVINKLKRNNYNFKFMIDGATETEFVFEGNEKQLTREINAYSYRWLVIPPKNN